MSMYMEALQAKLKCPCGVKNVINEPPVIVLAPEGVGARCTKCGRSGSFAVFLAGETK